MHPNKKGEEWCEEVARPVGESASNIIKTHRAKMHIQSQDLKKQTQFPSVHQKIQTATQGVLERVEDDVTRFIGRRPTSI